MSNKLHLGIKGFDKMIDELIIKYGDDVINETNKDMDGYEIFLEDGFKFVTTECRSLFEMTLSDLKSSLKSGIVSNAEFDEIWKNKKER